MDETAFLRAQRNRPTMFVSGLVDTATGRLLDVVEDRTARVVAAGCPAATPRGWKPSGWSRWTPTAVTPTPSPLT